MFIFYKKTSGWWHSYNNGAKEVNLSDWNIVLDEVTQTVVLQALNGSNIPKQAVGIDDVQVIDETDASVVETFASVELLRTRLNALNYSPYLENGAIQSIVAGTNVTVDNTDPLNPIVSASGGGGGSQDLQSVLDEGNSANSTDFLSYIKIDLDEVDPLIEFYAGEVENVNGGASFSKLNTDVYYKDADEQLKAVRFSAIDCRIQNTGVSNNNALVIPVADNDTNFSLPSDKATGDYILATLDDITPETTATIGALIGSAGDATPNNTDYVATALTAGGLLKKITWTNVKAFLKTYFDTLYEVLTNKENSVLNYDTDKYPTLNLVKTSIDNTIAPYIEITDLLGEAITSLSSARAFIENFTAATKTNESFTVAGSGGVYRFSVPYDTDFDLATSFCSAATSTSNIKVDDSFGLIYRFSDSAFAGNTQNNILNRVAGTSFGDNAFDGATPSITNTIYSVVDLGADGFKDYIGRIDIRKFGTDGTQTLPADIFTTASLVWIVTDYANKYNDSGSPDADLVQAIANMSNVDSKVSYDGIDANETPAVSKITLTDGATTTWDFSTGSFAEWTIGGNRTLSITNLPSGVVASGILKMIQNGTGGYTPTLTGNFGDVSYRIGAGDVNLLGFYWDGTSLFWSSSYSEGSGGTGATLATPTNFVTTTVTDDAITMTWDAVTNATGYTIERDVTNAFASPTTILTFTNVLTYTDSGLAPLTTYYYRIKALAVGFLTSNWVVVSDTTDAPSGYLTWSVLGADATFGCEQYNSSKGIRRKTTSDGWGTATGVAVSNETLSNGQRLKFKINAVSKAVAVSLGTSTAADSESGASGLNFGIYVGYGLTNSLGRKNNGTYDNTPNQTYAAGDWAALYYDGSFIRLQHSTDGVTFTTWRTAAATPSGSYNVQIQFYSGKHGTPAFGLDEVIIS